MIYDEMNKFFEDNGYIVIENFLNSETIGLFYQYTKFKARRESIIEATNSLDNGFALCKLNELRNFSKES